MAMTMATTMIATWSTMPTAVMTESSENTMSRSMICRDGREAAAACPAPARVVLAASTLS